MRREDACWAPRGAGCRSAARPCRRRCRRRRCVPARSAAASAASSTTPPRATLSRNAVGFIRASSAAPIRPFVAFVTGTWSGDRVGPRRGARRTRPARPRGARPAPADTNGSAPITTISRARARSAIAWPILPRPTMPERLAAQLDARERAALPLAAAHRGVGGGDLAGQREQERERELGRGDRVAGRGVDHGDPGPRGGVEVDVVDAHAGPADDGQPRAGGDHLGVDLDLAAHDQRVVVGEDRPVDLLAREARAARRPRDARRRSSTPSSASGSATRILMPGLLPGRLGDPADERGRWAAATAAPGSTGRSRTRAATSSRTPIAPRMSSRLTAPRWPTRKILALQLALAAGEDEAARAFSLAVERLPVEVVGDPGGGHRVRGDGAGRRGAGSRAPAGRRGSRRRTRRGGRRRRPGSPPP